MLIFMVISECWFQTDSTCGESKKPMFQTSCPVVLNISRRHVTFSRNWLDMTYPSWSPGFELGQDTMLGLQQRQTLHCNLLISCSIHICKSSCYSKDVAMAAGKWYGRTSSTSSMEDWPWNALWDIDLSSYFHFPMLSGTSPVMHVRTLRPVVLLVSLLIIFFSLLTLFFGHLTFSASFPHPMFLF